MSAPVKMKRLYIIPALSSVVSPTWAQQAPGQQCPTRSTTGEYTEYTASEPRTLEGQLVFHDGIRKWFELKLGQPQCGQASIQMPETKRIQTRLEVLRGCRVRTRGAISFSLRDYSSLETFQSVDKIKPVGPCVRQPPFPDYSRAKPDRTVRAYRVDMNVDYEPGDHPIVFRVSGSGKDLQPWWAYASYWLTGTPDVLYGFCAEGYVVDKVFGTPQANPSLSGESQNRDAMFDPVSAADSGKKNMHLGYTCVRKQ